MKYYKKNIIITTCIIKTKNKSVSIQALHLDWYPVLYPESVLLQNLSG